MSGQFTITGVEQGLLSGGKTVGPVTVSGSATVGQISDVSLSAGDNTIAIPSGELVTAVLIVVSSSNASVLKVRTNLNASDTGLPIGSQGPFLTSLASGVTSVIVNAAGGGALIEATFI